MSKKNIAIIFLLFFIIIFIFIQNTYKNKSSKIIYYDYGNINNRIKIGFVGSVHGNEPVGCHALSFLINTNYFSQIAKKQNIFIRVIPCVNKWGLKHNSRYQLNLLHPDINRNFNNQGSDDTSRQIIKLIKNMDWVIDIHEGYDFYLLNNQSVGSTLSPSYHLESKNISDKMISAVNNTILDSYKKFTVLTNNSCRIKNTLACYRQHQNKKYILIEISGQNNIQPLELRKQQTINLIKAFFNNLNFKS